MPVVAGRHAVIFFRELSLPGFTGDLFFAHMEIFPFVFALQYMSVLTFK